MRRLAVTQTPVKDHQQRKKDKYLELARELEKLWNMKVTVVPIIISALGTVIKGLVQGLDDLEIRRRVETFQTAALLGSENTEKSPVDLRRLAITQTSMRNHWLTLM